MMFKPGDTVRLKSGGPVMTVMAEWNADEGTVKCQWFVVHAQTPYELKDGIFPYASLKAVTAD
jgi:uncharacterized protein YodC (DUF2158 family)